MTDTKQTVPAGYRADDKGRLVLEKNIRPIDLIRDDLVNNIIARAKATREVIADFRRKAEADVEAFLKLAAEEHGVEFKAVKGKGNLTLKSFDGNRKIIFDSARRLDFDEKIHIAKQLLDECIIDWSEGINDNLRTLIDQAFELDQSGKMDVRAILHLSRLNIDDEKWRKAVALIRDSVTTESTKSYIRCYERPDDSSETELIGLDIASV